MPAARQTRPNLADIDAGERRANAADLLRSDRRPASEDDRLMLEVAVYLRDRRLAPLAILWLESCRPLTFLGSQALQAATPLIDVFYPRLPLARLTNLLEDRCNLDQFLAYLAARDVVDTRVRSTPARDEPGGAA